MFAAPLAFVLLSGLAAAEPPTWKITSNNSLLWDSKPYLPVGLRIAGTVEAVNQAAAAGVEDVLVELSAEGADWEPVITALRENNLRYFITISSTAPTAEVYAIEPEAYRTGPTEKPTSYTMRIPSAKDALVLVASQGSATIRWSKRIPVIDGKLKFDVDEPSLPHIGLAYPRLNDLRAIDFWEGFDRRRDEVLMNLKKAKLGAGYRGFVNPLGVVASFAGIETRYVPTSPLFRLEFEEFLRKKYGAPETALKAWLVSGGSLKTFAQMATLVPLWSESRGIGGLWCPDNDMIYPCEQGKSLAWKDIQEAIRVTSARRFSRFTEAVRKVAAGPVVQDWAGWNGPYESVQGSLDGVSVSCDAPDTLALIDSASKAAGSNLHRNRASIFMVSSLSLVTKEGAPGLEDSVRELESLGARAWFIRAASDAARKAVATLAKSRAADTSASEWKPKAVFFPEPARNPANPCRIGGGTWWLPTPEPGNRIDFGSDYYGYRITEAGKYSTVIWAAGQPRKTNLRLANTNGVTIRDISGLDVVTKAKKTGIEVVIGNDPIVVEGTEEIPVPEDAYAQTLALDEWLTRKNTRGTYDETERYYLANASKGFDKSPGSSFDAMRSQARRLMIKSAPYRWIEAESSPNHLFSEISKAAGASGGTVLGLTYRQTEPLMPRFADYVFAPTMEGEHEIWVAARVSAQVLKAVTVRIGETVLKPDPSAKSKYGDGFAWYKFGSINLPAKPTKLTVIVDGSADAVLDLDAIVVAPGTFAPDGPRLPTDWIPTFSAPARK